MKRVLITGANGFLGSHLAEFWIDQGLTVYGTIHRDSRHLAHLGSKIAVLRCDIMNREEVEAALSEALPDLVFHLAAQSLPVLSWRDPETTFRVNVIGTFHLLEAIRKTMLNPAVLVAGSSAEYGLAPAGEVPLREDAPLRPANPYAVSKTAQGQLADLYWRAYKLRVVRVRPFSIIGARKVNDACSDFARGVAAVERGEHTVLKIGNLEAVRDFLDVRDAVQALAVVAERGDPGEVYNICSGVGRSLREVLEMLLSLSGTPIQVAVEPARLRPIDEPRLVGDNTKLRSCGWEAQIPLATSLGSILESWRTAAKVAG